MARATPEDTFAEAQAALARGDWADFFARLDRAAVRRIAENSLNGFVNQGEAGARALRALGAAHAIAEDLIAELYSRAQGIVDSAQAFRATAADLSSDAARERSRRHQETVARYQQALARVLEATPDLDRWTAALERERRLAGLGGSVSARLFVGERLEDVTIEKNQAWGTRRTANGHAEDLGFVKRRGGWFIRLSAKRPRTRAGGREQSG